LNNSHTQDNIPISPVPLPAKITAITTQKNAERYNIFLNNIFFLGISEEILLEFKLQKGDTVTEEIYRKLYKREFHHKLRSYFLSLLSRRDYSRLELFRKAQKNGYEKRNINAVLNELEEKRLLDETRFIQAFVKDKFSINRWGPAKIAAKLREKGIGKNDIDSALKQLISEEKMRTVCHKLLHKKSRRFLRESDLYKRKQKMLRFLAGRGFPAFICYQATEDFLKSCD